MSNKINLTALCLSAFLVSGCGGDNGGYNKSDAEVSERKDQIIKSDCLEQADKEFKLGYMETPTIKTAEQKQQYISKCIEDMWDAEQPEVIDIEPSLKIGQTF